jgi:LuxR family maltose regulon positive regulatory protein
MGIPLTRTKILLPRRPASLLTRQRLLDLLYELLDYRLLIVAAPAGYGKTSLLVDLAHHVELPVCWYTLDTLDQDPQRFVAHLIASIAQCFPDFGQRSTAALHDAAATSNNLDYVAATIVDEAHEHIREHFALVLDDYHLVSASKAVNHFVSRFVQEVDENCHLILSSRSLLALPDLPLMVARSQVSGLSFEELAFHPDEIRALVFQNYHLTMPGAVVEELAQETEGWVTGLLLSAHTMWQGMADRVRLARVSGVGVYDYLAQQVLDQQPASIRDFLLRTSILEEFDAELCAATLGTEENWPNLIDAVLQRNLFVLPVDNQGTWLRYHHLFRDFLQARLTQERPDEKDRLLRRLATVYAERGEWEKAHEVCQRLGDVAATADLIERVGAPMVQSGRWMALAEWLDALPADTLASRPVLLSLRGIVAATLGQVERGVTLQNQAVADFRALGDLPHLARALVRRAVDHRLLGDYQAALADAEEALTLAEGDENLRTVQAEALRAKGLSLFKIGQLNEAVEWLEQSLAAYTALSDEQNVAMLFMDLGMAYRSSGRYERALAHYDRALDYWRKVDNVAQQANLLNNLGVLCHLKGDYEQAASLLEEALDCARQSGCVRIEALALSSIGDLYTDLDAPDAALDACRQAHEVAGRIDYRFLLLYLDLAEAALARSRGDLERALDLLDSATQMAQGSGSDYERGLCQLEAGRLALAEGDGPEAVARLQEAVRRFDDGGQRVESARAHLYLAVACQAAGDERTALAHLERAFRHASTLGSPHTLVVAGRGAATLLEAAENDPTVGRQASQLLGQIARFERDVPSLRRRLRRQTAAVPFAPPRLTIQALGLAQVALDGRPVTAPEWQSRRAVRDLFFLLLAHPDGMTKEQVGAIFWPDSSPAQLKLHFKNAIYRLRRALGQDVVLLDEDLYWFNPALDYEYDVEAFGEKLAQAQAATDPGERAAAYREAIDLYTGSYLPEMEGAWVWPERERLWQAYVEAVLRLAEFHLETGEYELALEYCRRALVQDPSLEAAHCLAMRAHAAMGDRAAVARQFERCQQTLLAEINVPPSPQTEALYETLMR